MSQFPTDIEIEHALQKFDEKLMNNAKWRKVCKLLCMQDPDIYINIKFVYYDKPFQSMNYDLEYEHKWIEECRQYREVEYLEVNKYEPIESKDKHYSEVEKSIVEQDINKIYDALKTIGELPLEVSEDKIILRAYK